MTTSFQSPERYGAIFGAGTCFRVKRMVDAGGCLSMAAQTPGHHTLLFPIAADLLPLQVGSGTGRPRAGRLSSQPVALGRFGHDGDTAAELNLLRRFKAAGCLSFFHRANTVRQDLRRDQSNSLHVAPFAPASHEQDQTTESVGNVQFQVGAVRNVEC